MATWLATLRPDGALLLISAAVAGCMLLLALKLLAGELEFHRRWHELRTEADRLRNRQHKRLHELGMKRLGG